MMNIRTTAIINIFVAGLIIIPKKVFLANIVIIVIFTSIPELEFIKTLRKPLTQGIILMDLFTLMSIELVKYMINLIRQNKI